MNQQNCRFQATTNPNIRHKKPLHYPYITVWMAVASCEIIGLNFFEENNKLGCVNTERYVNMIENFVIPKLKNMKKFSSLWFQQDGATPHTTKKKYSCLEKSILEPDSFHSFRK